MKRMSPSAFVGGALLSLYVLAALLGPAVTSGSPVLTHLDQTLEVPSRMFPLGTDENGIDLLAMLLAGIRLSLFVAVCTTAISVGVGAAIGAWAGLRGGWFDELVMRVVDVFLAFPGIILNLALVALLARPGTAHLIFALSLTGWVSYARVARGQAQVLRTKEFVLASRLAGGGTFWILRKHVLPNMAATLMVQATYGFASVIVAETSLSFLGLGAHVPYSLGALLAQGTTYLWRSMHMALVPGLALAMLILGCNLMGDVLHERLTARRISRLA